MTAGPPTWSVTDLYPDLNDLRTHGQTIVYSVHGSIGHLGIFVSGGVALIWLLLLAFMLWPCAWYYRKKRERPNWITRYV